MIKNRRKHLLSDPTYSTRPPFPYLVDWSSVPNLVRASTLEPGGKQPTTGAMFEAADGTITDVHSEGKVQLFRQKGTLFQMVSVVASLIPIGERDGHLLTSPFALTLIPASKRGEVDHVDIEQASRPEIARITRDAEAFYTGFDPFTGEWASTQSRVEAPFTHYACVKEADAYRPSEAKLRPRRRPL